MLSQGNRGFESPPLRQVFFLEPKIGAQNGVCWLRIGLIRVEPKRGRVTGTDIPHISPFKRNGEVIGWVTVLGLDGEGNLRRKFFREKNDAERFLDDHQRLSVDPFHGRRHEVMFCLERIDRMGVSLHEVVKFYDRHGSKKSNPLLVDSIKTFFDHKRMIGRGHHYVERMTVVLRQLTEFVGETTKVGDITSDQIRKFVYVGHGHTSPKSKQNLLTHLSVFFGFCICHGLTSLNPVTKDETEDRKSPTRMSRPKESEFEAARRSPNLHRHRPLFH